MVVVLDTCAVLWLTLNPQELSPKAHRVIASADRIAVCSVSVWEIGIKSLRKRIELGTDFEDYVDRLSHTASIELMPIDHWLWAKSVLLDWEHRDSADRVIVTLAQQLEATLVTEDREMTKFYKDCVS